MHLDPSQQAAVDLMLVAPFCVVTGGPGVGKTTTLRVALDELDQLGKTYALASPTGKAARRMSEATGRTARTIHRLLGWTYDGWTYDADNPLDFDVVVVDECSMLDVELGAALLEACAPDTRVIFVGDANQLPSVGPGRVLADLVESNAVPVARLTTLHRSGPGSWVCRNAPRVLAGAALELQDAPDFRFVEVEEAGDAARTVQRLVAMPEYQGAQVIAPQKNTACGVEAMNLALQQQLNPPRATAAEWKMGERTLRKGDRVIQTVNAYKLESTMGELGVFNGEVGTIVDVAERLTVDFGDATAPRKVPYTRDDAQHLQHAYALTCHRCQGSEFPWVIAIVHSAHSFMLSRALFYTAITRAKVGVVLVGNGQGIEVATSAKSPPVRNTALVQRMATLSPEADKQARLTW
jgi:exodeoxyribonuclease V alpha subunit